MEIVLEALNEKAELAAELLKDAMEKAGKIYVGLLEMTAKPVILDHWDH